MKLIPLSQSVNCKNRGLNLFAKVSDIDYDELIKWKWSAIFHHGKWSARRSEKQLNGTKKNIVMARYISGATKFEEVYYKDDDSLNFQRDNFILKNIRRKIQESELIKILELIKTKSNKEIGEIYGVNDKYVSGFLFDNKITRGFIDWDNIKKRTCTSCLIEKDIIAFRKIKSKNGKFLYRSDCMECANKRNTIYNIENKEIRIKKSKERYKKDIVVTMFTLSKHRALKKKIPFNLDMTFLRKKWLDCNGKCELSKIDFDLTVTSEPNIFRPSLDRIKNENGYTKDNIRIILWGLNRAINKDGLDIYLKIANGVISNMPQN